ncbi:TPA: hypothetical protein ACJ3IM_000602 [Neisseria meningitidis]|uniref:hypothetical protein n=1 Tax=Neisseria meningitidis TaxID=487 RepID=UPI000E56846D|nr:hypothetical protein [Neisseria meningitidis]
MFDVKAAGRYFFKVNDEPWEAFDNLITAEGLNFILNTALGDTPKPEGLYLALFSGSAAPAANWTAASFPSAANEIVSQTEGYSNASRPLWRPQAASNGQIGNLGAGGDDVSAAAKVTIVTSSSINVAGMALTTSSGKGSQSGVLVSAAKLPIPRTLQNGDTFFIGYRLALTA